MTLDDAIAHAREVAAGCGECAEEHAQLADWLDELRALKASNDDGEAMSMLGRQIKELWRMADELDEHSAFIGYCGSVSRDPFIRDAVFLMREAADTIESLRDRLQSVGETCSIEWRGESYDTDAGREYDGAYFCTKCMADLPYSLQEDWDDYQALVADYGNVPPWDKKPFRHCPNCGREVVDA